MLQRMRIISKNVSNKNFWHSFPWMINFVTHSCNNGRHSRLYRTIDFVICNSGRCHGWIINCYSPTISQLIMVAGLIFVYKNFSFEFPNTCMFEIWARSTQFCHLLVSFAEQISNIFQLDDHWALLSTTKLAHSSL